MDSTSRSEMIELRDQLQSVLGTTYAVERELGGGGMSRVFLARELALGRMVVLKVLPPDLMDAVSDERFRREIRFTAQLQHPHLVPVLTAGDVNGLPYFTMPFVDGESLRERLARERASGGSGLAIDEAVHLLRDVAAALEHAHEHGIVHRDVKPANVLLSNGNALLTDLGIAKVFVESQALSGPALTRRSVMLGTPAYMAPEQIDGSPAVDARADVYAWGATAYEVLTGATPFAGREPGELLDAHRSERPAPLTQRRPDVPTALADLVTRALAKRPGDRPSSARELVVVLDRSDVRDVPATVGAITTTLRRTRTMLVEAIARFRA